MRCGLSRSNEKFGGASRRTLSWTTRTAFSGELGGASILISSFVKVLFSRSARFGVRPRLFLGQRAPGDAFGVLDERLVAQQAAGMGMASNVVGGICGSESV